MHAEAELQFLRDVLHKNHVHTLLCEESDPATAALPLPDPSEEPFPRPQLPAGTEPYTLYKLTDPFDLCYLYLRLPSGEPPVLLIGPYLSAFPSRERLLELGEKRGVSPSQQAHFEEYYLAIPVLGEGDRLFTVITGFCERLWHRPSFAIVDVNRAHDPSPSLLSAEMGHQSTLDDTLVNMKAMELRYSFENELIRAVSLGQVHKEDQLLSALSDRVFEKRLTDPLRNAKNYCIIMNTLLRKAAENGGVHPIYIDRVSSGFASDIEALSDLSAVSPLMRTMFRSWCRLVRRHALTHYSLAVQKTIVLIDSDLSAPLTLARLAAQQNISAGYLSTLFRHETGKTVSEYIRERRLRHAAHLLATTQLQIQTVALHCGIVDVQYFSKLFKRETGKTPKEYREDARAKKP